MKENKIIVAGIGPGSPEDITPAVVSTERIRCGDCYNIIFSLLLNGWQKETECVDIPE